MKFYVMVAWRNIWRNARRSVITAFAMAISVSLCMALIVINDGFYSVFFDVMVSQKLGHVQVQNPKYAKTKSLYETITQSDQILKKIKDSEKSTAVTGRLYSSALVSVGGDTEEEEGEKSGAGQVIGINPADEKNVTTLYKQIETGNYLSDEAKKEVIIGITLSDELGSKVGDDLFVFTQGVDGSPAYDLYNIVGVYKSGSTIMDRGFQVHVQDLQQLLLMENQLHEIVVLADSEEEIPGLATELRNSVETSEDNEKTPIQVKTWWETSPQTKELMAFRDVGSFIFLGIVFFIAGFGILNTMLMSVFERTRELGVIKALGLRPIKMILLIVIESIFLSGLAALMGLVMGAFFAYLLVEYGVDMSGGTGEPLKMMGVNLDPQMKGVVKMDFLMLPVVFLFVISVLASLWPAIRAARLNPIEAIRSE